VETDNVAIQRERLSIVERRRAADDADDVAIFTGLPIHPPSATSEGDPAPSFESPRSHVRQVRRMARQARRASESKTNAKDEGLSSDDALDVDDSASLTEALESLAASNATVLADVESDEYLDPSLSVAVRFGEWRRRYGAVYGNAFAGLAMVGVWEFWARMEMAPWNPFGVRDLQSSPASLSEWNWHGAIAAYSEQMHDEGDVLDDEGQLVNALVDKVVVPQLQKLATEAYDPFSVTATKRALGLVEEVTMCLDREGRKYQVGGRPSNSHESATLMTCGAPSRPWFALFFLDFSLRYFAPRNSSSLL
jgi:GC-rich sequence DNA-binding factor